MSELHEVRARKGDVRPVLGFMQQSDLESDAQPVEWLSLKQTSAKHLS